VIARRESGPRQPLTAPIDAQAGALQRALPGLHRQRVTAAGDLSHAIDRSGAVERGGTRQPATRIGVPARGAPAADADPRCRLPRAAALDSVGPVDRVTQVPDGGEPLMMQSTG